MVTLISIVLLIVIFEVAALRWGSDSRDGIASDEWERRHWRDPNYTCISHGAMLPGNDKAHGTYIRRNGAYLIVNHA